MTFFQGSSTEFLIQVASETSKELEKIIPPVPQGSSMRKVTMAQKPSIVTPEIRIQEPSHGEHTFELAKRARAFFPLYCTGSSAALSRVPATYAQYKIKT